MLDDEWGDVSKDGAAATDGASDSAEVVTERDGNGNAENCARLFSNVGLSK